MDRGQLALQFALAFLVDADQQLRSLLAYEPQERDPQWQAEMEGALRYCRRAESHYQEVEKLVKGRMLSRRAS